MNPTKTLHKLGQSLWLDNITRDLLNSGTLQRYIDEFSVTGLTSNPTIFDHAIRNSADYDRDIARRLSYAKSAEDLFFELALADLTRAADLLRGRLGLAGLSHPFLPDTARRFELARLNKTLCMVFICSRDLFVRIQPIGYRLLPRVGLVAGVLHWRDMLALELLIGPPRRAVTVELHGLGEELVAVPRERVDVNRRRYLQATSAARRSHHGGTCPCCWYR
jgi:hypothetical protein